MAGGVAHDFNNLLCVIMVHADMALAKVKPNNPLFLHFTEMREAAHRATILTRQLLAFSRKQVIEPKVFDLNKTVADLQKMLAWLIRKDIELRVAFGTEGLVRADPTQIDQVIINLVVNARDAMPHGGKISIEIANVTLAQADIPASAEIAAGNYVRLTVRDTGSGMSDEVQAHLFEPFFTTKPVGEGTGLGLATCYGIVKQCGGAIAVESAVGQGTTFRIYLPLIATPATVVGAEQLTEHSLRGTETILLVEDDAMVREATMATLSELGYRLLPAANG